MCRNLLKSDPLYNCIYLITQMFLAYLLPNFLTLCTYILSKFFNRLFSKIYLILKIYQKTCTKIAYFSNQGEFRKKSNDAGGLLVFLSIEIFNIRYWLSLFVCMSFGLCAQQRIAPFNLQKITPSLHSGQDLKNISGIKPPLLVQNIVIMIDPGHGGHDIGTQSISKPRYQEKSLNLVTAKFVRDYLHQLGYQVMITRETDKFISLERRAQMANESHPVLFVSIHYNSAPSAEAQGVEVFFYQSQEKKERTAKSKRLAQVVLKHIIAETKAKSRGVKNGNFLVIRETLMPAILIEGGFVTNDAELQKLKDPCYLKRLAWGVVQGIEEYLN